MAQPDPKLRGADGVFRWVFGPNWDAGKFDFDHDMTTVDAKLGPEINALGADLGPFVKHGGKLIMFHGWSDMVVSSYDSIIYFDRINKLDSADKAEDMTPSSFSRLFMVPGMGHCSEGHGIDSFGQGAPPDGPPNPDKDIVLALDKWVETGVAPEQIVAAKQDHDGAVTAERPLCSYPWIAKYNGTGDPKVAASFSCVQAPVGKIEFTAPEYLR
jgi:feruloyl esterase